MMEQQELKEVHRRKTVRIGGKIKERKEEERLRRESKTRRPRYSKRWHSRTNHK